MTAFDALCNHVCIDSVNHAVDESAVKMGATALASALKMVSTMAAYNIRSNFSA